MEEELIQSYLGEIIEGNYQTAIYQLSKCITNNPENYHTLLLRAIAYSEKGEYSNALNDLENAEKIIKTPDVDFLYLKGKTLFYNQNYDESKKELERALGVEGITDEVKAKINSLLAKI